MLRLAFLMCSIIYSFPEFLLHMVNNPLLLSHPLTFLHSADSLEDNSSIFKYLSHDAWLSQ